MRADIVRRREAASAVPPEPAEVEAGPPIGGQGQDGQLHPQHVRPVGLGVPALDVHLVGDDVPDDGLLRLLDLLPALAPVGLLVLPEQAVRLGDLCGLDPGGGL